MGFVRMWLGLRGILEWYLYDIWYLGGFWLVDLLDVLCGESWYLGGLLWGLGCIISGYFYIFIGDLG